MSETEIEKYILEEIMKTIKNRSSRLKRITDRDFEIRGFRKPTLMCPSGESITVENGSIIVRNHVIDMSDPDCFERVADIVDQSTPPSNPLWDCIVGEIKKGLTNEKLS